MIAVTFALPTESIGLREFLGGRGSAVAIFHTGVGEKTCRERIETFLSEQNFQFLISAGFAGGIEDSLGVGDLVLARNFSDARLSEIPRELLVLREGNLATSDHVIESAEERTRFAREHDAIAVDMETAWIAESCAQHNLPLISLRTISDTAAAPFPAPPAVLFDLERQKTNYFALIKYLLRHPSGFVRLPRFAAQIREARASLTNAMIILLRELAHADNFA
jgi:adenosylhomocysteine nucleosidase